MKVIGHCMPLGLFAVLLIQIGPCFSTRKPAFPFRKPTMAYCEGIQEGQCCMRFPRAMDINKFKSMVATGEDWAELFFYVCPYDEPFAALRQCRASINVTNGIMTRLQNFKPSFSEPCVGPFNNTFEQVGTTTAVFRQTGEDGLMREDRYIDTGALQDYHLLFSCRDTAGARRGLCFNYFIAILIRNDPPANFPWDKAVRDMQRFGIKPRDLTFVYSGDVCPVN